MKQHSLFNLIVLLLSFSALLSPPVIAQSFWEQDGPEDMIVSVYANNQPIMATLYALYDQQLYVPLSELAAELGLPVVRDAQQRQVLITAAYRLPAYQVHLLEDGQLRVSQRGEPDRLWPADAWLEEMWDAEGELYLSLAYMEQLWPIYFNFNLNRLRLDLRTDEPLPELEARARQRLRELRLRQIDQQQLTAPGLPYAMISPPLIEWNARYQSNNRRENYGVIARHDLLGFGHEWQAQINNNRFRDDYELTRLRWMGSYYAAESGSPSPLLGGIQQVEVGDIRTSTLQGAPSATQGRGLMLSSFKAGQSSVFATQVITGFAPAGWEADLYINQQLVDYQQVKESGTYEFEAYLQQGYNHVEVRLFGPLGEERIDRFNFQLGQDYLERGEFAVSLSVFQPEQDLLGIEQQRTRALHQPDLSTHVDLGIGISPSLSLRGHWRQQQFQDDFDESSAHQLGWTLGGVRGLWSWEWQQLFEGSDYFTRIEAQRSTARTLLSLAIFEHPEWPVYQREGRFVEREYQLRSHYQLAPLSRLPLRLGLNAKREEYSLYRRDELELTQQWRLHRWAFNLHQRCSFYDAELDDLCSFGHSTRYSHLGLRANLDTTSDRYRDSGWYRHQWRVQTYYDLSRLSSAPVWQDWTRRFQLRGQYGQTHYTAAERDTERRWLYELTWRQTLRYVDLGWSVGREDFAGWNASLQLSGSFLPGLGGYQALGDKFHRPAHVQAYYDTNYDGRFNRGEEVAPEVALRQRSRASAPADARGQIWLNLIPHSELDLDLRSVDDPYIVSGRSPFRLASRPERVVPLYWPLIETGAVDGELISPEGRALINQRIELRRLDQTPVDTIFTAFDGFWAFEFVPPGEYEVHWVQAEQSQLLAQIRLTPEQLWLSLMDLDINEPRMLAAALADQPEVEEAVRQIQRSSRQGFVERAMQRQYTFLGLVADAGVNQAVIFDHMNYQVVRLQQGESLGEAVFELETFNHERAVVIASGQQIELKAAYQLVATERLPSGEWVADLRWRDTRPSSLFPYDRVSVGSQLYAAGEVISIQSNRVVLQWQDQQLVLGTPLSSAVQPRSTPVSTQAPSHTSATQPASQRWLTSSFAPHRTSWTLQVMSSADQAAVEAFVRTHPALRYYRRAHPSHPWVVLYGQYPDRAAAEAARRNLPAALSALQPWPRSHSQIESEIIDD